MKRLTRLLAATMLIGGLATAAEAKTLVYCAEGSPENFNPQINTTGTSFDAARPAYNQLVEFEPGTTMSFLPSPRAGMSRPTAPR